MSRYALTLESLLRAPQNINKVVRQIKDQFSNIDVNIKAQVDPRGLANVNREVQALSRNAVQARKEYSALADIIGTGARRFAAISFATGTFVGLARSIKSSLKEAILFEKEMLTLSQVTGKTVPQLQDINDEVVRLSKSLGVSSDGLLNTAIILAQAGFSAKQTKNSLEVLAKTQLAASFSDIDETGEGAIAILSQFRKDAIKAGGDAKFLEQALGAINEVSKAFAVEASDLISTVRKTGGAFEAAGGSLNELFALFTSVRATTRESAETIATGLRTIFTRIQRVETINQLQKLGIVLQDVEGKFVGPYEAIMRISEGLSSLDPRDIRFASITEELGGFRQIGKVIPLLKQTALAQQALAVAQGATNSLTEDQVIAQQSLENQFKRVKEEFQDLVRTFQKSETFQGIVKSALNIASAMIKVAESLEPILPLLISLGGIQLGKGIASIFSGGRTPFSVRGYASGGKIPGGGNSDTVPAMLTPGEFVLRKSAVKNIGVSNLNAMNSGKDMPVQYFKSGGEVRASKLYDANVQGSKTLRKKIDQTPNWGHKQGGHDDILSVKYSVIEIDPLTSNSIDDVNKYIKAKLSYESSGEYSNLAKGTAFEKIVSRRVGKTLNTANDFLDLPYGEVKSDKAYGPNMGPDADAYLSLLSKSLNSKNSYLRRFTGKIDRVSPTSSEITLYVDKYRRSSREAVLKRAQSLNKRRPNDKQIFIDPQFFATGGTVPGAGNKDTVPAMLTPGEFVMKKSAVQNIGVSNLQAMNNGQQVPTQHFAQGGVVLNLKRNKFGAFFLNPLDEGVDTLTTNSIGRSIGDVAKATQLKILDNIQNLKGFQNKGDFQDKILSSRMSLAAGGTQLGKGISLGPDPQSPVIVMDDYVRYAVAEAARKYKDPNSMSQEQSKEFYKDVWTIADKLFYKDNPNFPKSVDGQFYAVNDVDDRDSQRFEKKGLIKSWIGSNYQTALGAIDKKSSNIVDNLGGTPIKTINISSIRDIPALYPSGDNIREGYQSIIDDLMHQEISAAIKNIGSGIARSSSIIDDSEFSKASNSLLKDKTARSAIGGYIFEALIGGLTGILASGQSDYFDYPISQLGAKASELSKVFGNSNIISSLDYADAKYALTRTTEKNMITQKIPNQLASFDPAEFGQYLDNIKYFASGGLAKGTDTVPAMLTPGEFIINKASAQKIGYDNLRAMNGVGSTDDVDINGISYFASGGRTRSRARRNKRRSQRGPTPVRSISQSITNELDPEIEQILLDAVIREQNLNSLYKDRSSAGMELSEEELLDSIEGRHLRYEKNRSLNTKVAEFQSRNKNRAGTSSLNQMIGGANLTSAASQPKTLFNEANRPIGRIQYEDIATQLGLEDFKARIDQVIDAEEDLIRVTEDVTKSRKSADYKDIDPKLAASIDRASQFQARKTAAQKDPVKVAVENAEAQMRQTQKIDAFTSKLASSGLTFSILASTGGQLASQFGMFSKEMADGIGQATMTFSAIYGIGTSLIDVIPGMGKFKMGLTGLTLGISVVLAAVEYFASQARSQADKANKAFDEMSKNLSEGKDVNLADMQKKAVEASIQMQRASNMQTGGTIGAVVGGVAAGALGGAKTGAALGSFLGPIGTIIGTGVAAAIGAAVGGIAGVIIENSREANSIQIEAANSYASAQYTAIKSIYDFTSSLEQSKLRNLNSIETSRLLSAETAKLVDSQKNTSNELNNYEKLLKKQEITNAGGIMGLFGSTIGVSEQDTKRLEDIKSSIAEQKSALTQARNELQTSIAASADEFGKSGNNFSLILQKISPELITYRNTLMATMPPDTAQKTYNAFLDGLKRASSANDKLIKNTALLNAAFLQQREDVLNTVYALRQFSSIEFAGDKFTTSLDNLITSINGGVVSFKTITLPSIKDFPDINVFGKELLDITKPLGQYGEAARKNITNAATVFQRAQDTLLNRQILGTGEGSIRSAEDLLDQLGINNLNLSSTIVDQIRQNFGKIVGEQRAAINITDEVLQQLLEPVFSQTQPSIDVLNKATAVTGKKFGDLVKTIDELDSSFTRINDLQKSSIDINSRLQDNIEKITGNTVSGPGRRQAERTARAQISLNRFGLKANDISGLGSAIVNARRQMSAMGGNINTPEGIIKFNQLNETVQAASDRLKELSNQSELTTDIMAQFEKVQSGINQKNSKIEEFIIGGTESRANMMMDFSGLQTAIATGSFQTLTDEMRGRVSSLLESLSDVEIMPGATGSDIRKSLLAQDFMRMGATQQQAAQLVGAATTSQQDKLIASLTAISQNEQAANAQLINTEMMAANTLFEAANIIRNTFGQLSVMINKPEYRALGGFMPSKGTDTIPAMLSPGEYVLRSSAVSKYGTDFLDKINKGEIEYRAKGGSVGFKMPESSSGWQESIVNYLMQSNIFPEIEELKQEISRSQALDTRISKEATTDKDLKKEFEMIQRRKMEQLDIRRQKWESPENIAAGGVNEQIEAERRAAMVKPPVAVAAPEPVIEPSLDIFNVPKKAPIVQPAKPMVKFGQARQDGTPYELQNKLMEAQIAREASPEYQKYLEMKKSREAQSARRKSIEATAGVKPSFAAKRRERIQERKTALATGRQLDAGGLDVGMNILNRANQGPVIGRNQGPVVGRVNPQQPIQAPPQVPQRQPVPGQANAQQPFVDVAGLTKVADNINMISGKIEKIVNTLNGMKMEHTVKFDGILSIGGLDIGKMKDEFREAISNVVISEVKKHLERKV